jgi:DNA-binding XRE family transcriptional regulator
LNIEEQGAIVPDQEHCKPRHMAHATKKKQGTETAAQGLAARFGALIRERREALKLRQDDIAFSTGLGRRFIIELEAGKPTCHLGKALVVAAAVGLRPIDLMVETNDDNAMLPDLPG